MLWVVNPILIPHISLWKYFQQIMLFTAKRSISGGGVFVAIKDDLRSSHEPILQNLYGQNIYSRHEPLYIHITDHPIQTWNLL